MHLFQDELAPIIFRSNLCAVLDYNFANSLLDAQLSCPMCFADMKLGPRPKLSDVFAWHCKKYVCGSMSYHSVRTGSFFAKTHVPLGKYLHVLYLWAQNSPVPVAADTGRVASVCAATLPVPAASLLHSPCKNLRIYFEAIYETERHSQCIVISRTASLLLSLGQRE